MDEGYRKKNMTNLRLLLMPSLKADVGAMQAYNQRNQQHKAMQTL